MACCSLYSRHKSHTVLIIQGINGSDVLIIQGIFKAIILKACVLIIQGKKVFQFQACMISLFKVQWSAILKA